MNHPFNPSQIDKSLCTVCDRNYIAHTAIAECEACGKKATCNIFGNPKNPKAMLLCEECWTKEVHANDLIIAQTQVNVIAKSKEIDNSIRFSGDIFNAETVAISDLKKAIDAEDGEQQAKDFKLHNLVMERIELYKQRIIEIDNEKFELIGKQQAGINALREFGATKRAEIRDRIKASDANYQPHQILPTNRIKKAVEEKKSPMDKLIDMYALMHNVSKEAAKEAIMKGKN